MKFPFLSASLCVMKSISQRLTRNYGRFRRVRMGRTVCGVPSTSTRNVTESLLPVASSSFRSVISAFIDCAKVETYQRGGAHVLYASRPSMSA